MPNIRKRLERSTERELTHWNRLQYLIPTNVKVGFWLLLIWIVMVNGDLIRHTWRYIGPLIIKSGLMDGPFPSNVIANSQTYDVY